MFVCRCTADCGDDIIVCGHGGGVVVVLATRWSCYGGVVVGLLCRAGGGGRTNTSTEPNLTVSGEALRQWVDAGMFTHLTPGKVVVIDSNSSVKRVAEIVTNTKCSKQKPCFDKNEHYGDVITYYEMLLSYCIWG